jgi:hypothetical protein
LIDGHAIGWNKGDAAMVAAHGTKAATSAPETTPG